ncbi:RNA binding domain-containing protein [Histoplasma capsulatum var. duboisii H88]|uniref:RNA binding domain-containing protein n=2 Tax=Ajellomyces capsulatus TaxID=5037 RepID=F0UM70_AJEC8|nr:RNA binding domain-containing protein [Histoplasma capsulatum H143]EGC47267.1 RNA binding domain-containing protein [Histoplasma capsulatum var. duboisii H88]QSS53435.1 RNA binding domain-containing protein [Histoplasma capsulatum var. duboisii H88]
MNAIRQVQALNKRELENVVPPEASWHADYRDTAYIYIGSLPSDLSEGDILTIFSQYGEPVHLNLVRDKETGKSKGFAFLKYEDQRSTDLAVDNLGGATILGRMIRVDHARYKRKEEEGLEDNVAALTVGETGEKSKVNGEEAAQKRATKHGDSDTDTEDRKIQQRPLLKEEKELQKLIEEHDDEDPMKEYLIQEKREEVAKALERLNKRKERRSDNTEKEDKHGHRHRHHRYHNRRHRGDRSYSPEREKQFSRHERSKSPSQLRERRHHRGRRDRG